MKDPVVLITGALTGIGRATALAFANEGGRIVASGRVRGAGRCGRPRSDRDRDAEPLYRY